MSKKCEFSRIEHLITAIKDGKYDKKNIYVDLDPDNRSLYSNEVLFYYNSHEENEPPKNLLSVDKDALIEDMSIILNITRW